MFNFEKIVAEDKIKQLNGLLDIWNSIPEKNVLTRMFYFVKTEI